MRFLICNIVSSELLNESNVPSASLKTKIQRRLIARVNAAYKKHTTHPHKSFQSNFAHYCPNSP